MLIRQGAITPDLWGVHDVCRFLCVNDCEAHCDSFRKKGIDGRLFLQLTKEQIANLTGMKVGPSLKIHDLIQALKVKAGLGSESTVTSHDITATTETVKAVSS